MRLPFTAAFGALAATLSLSNPAAALDPEFEALRAAARKHEAERASTPQPPPAAPTKPAGPSLAKFIPAAPQGWKLRNNPFDDAEGLVDLGRQASGRYVQAGVPSGPALEITLLAKGDLIGGGVPKLGLDAASGKEISEVSIAGHKAYLSWQAATRSGQLTFSVGRYQIIVAGRQATPDLLSQFANRIDLARLKAA
ncbi:MAG: hypothetical protein C0481_19505 [Phenylobacterium sp.]|uniref:hypothetical protein n=1 Tax=Phenylobacterium sp. TaxID=1871053 RepID=UPI0025D9BCD3|nr:hypothetical protein [Phenylobacterium sp.]MBA4014055.1 hypothetical protein [Phenylobacterium sp.]